MKRAFVLLVFAVLLMTACAAAQELRVGGSIRSVEWVAL